VAIVRRTRDGDERAPAAAATAAGGRALGTGGPESAEPRVGTEDGERPMCAANVRSAGRGGSHEGRERTGMAGTTWRRRVQHARCGRCGDFRWEWVVVAMDVEGSDKGGWVLGLRSLDSQDAAVPASRRGGARHAPQRSAREAWAPISASLSDHLGTHLIIHYLCKAARASP
jgi:hypothetical protein